MLFTVWVTEKCNLHCKYCYVEGARERKIFNYKSVCVDDNKWYID